MTEDKQKRHDDDAVLFTGITVALACILSALPVLLVGVLDLGDHDSATRDAVLAVGLPATGALAVLGLVMVFSIGGKWSPGRFFYAGVLIQGLYVSKFYFEQVVLSEFIGFVSVFGSATLYALDCRRSALDLAAARREIAQAELSASA